MSRSTQLDSRHDAGVLTISEEFPKVLACRKIHEWRRNMRIALRRIPRGVAGVKVRGREYLRIIYGPDYTEPRHLEQLRKRQLRHKRSLALREYALGLEVLDRLAEGEPLWRIRECVFVVLALESEPVDPRL
jgi:hypothetical protein